MKIVPIDKNEALILRIMGEMGYYESSDIYSSFLLTMQARGVLHETATQGIPEYALNKLIQKGFVIKEPIENPLKHRFAAYLISPAFVGNFESAFGIKPAPSLLSAYSDHATLTHYIGVKELEYTLRRSGNYHFVSSKRSDCSIHLLNGLEYIPDVITKFIMNGGGEGTAIFEYERNTHTQIQFEEKMEKAQLLHHTFNTKTSQINIITNNTENADAIRNKVQMWIDKAGIERLTHVIIRITTLTRLDFNIRNDRHVNDKKCWRWIFNIGKNGRVPELNNEKITRGRKKKET
jgi:hypothetical protein